MDCLGFIAWFLQSAGLIVMFSATTVREPNHVLQATYSNGIKISTEEVFGMQWYILPILNIFVF